MDKTYDFSGWATKANLKCSDGRVILKDAFKHCDGQKVPLCWGHQHNDPLRVLGHALLENRDEGVYTYCTFNETEAGQHAKEMVRHGDIVALSIYANQLKQDGCNVKHGAIREVSLVLAGANPGAFIDSVILHGEESSEEAIIFTGEDIMLAHSEDGQADEETNDPVNDNKEGEEVEESTEEIEHSEESKKNDNEKEDEESPLDVFDTLSEKQKNAVYAIIGMALEDDGESEENNNKQESKEINEGDKEMKHNAFEQQEENVTNTLSHDAMNTIIADAKRYGSMKESFLAHAQEYGIENIDFLFPEAKAVSPVPEFIKRDTTWVPVVMNGVSKSPFSRIKSLFADITEDEARAKGYIKGNLKKEEVFSLLKRSTTPTTVYKKQKLDRDDIVDITDFDVIAWLKAEMRGMLDEEIARAILIGDGRLASSDDKINEGNIRPIAKDDSLYTIQKTVDVKKDATDADKAEAFINAVIKSRKDYKGSGNPTLFTTEDVITDILLLEDGFKHKLYKSVAEVATALRVKEIVTVEVMEGVKGKNGKPLMGIVVNLNDYKVGADKGGAVNMFDDFDIDYNQQKYLIETRCSGALVKPYSAIALELNQAE